MADLGNIINVSLIPEGRLVQRDNMNVVSIITAQLGHLSTANRTDVYRSIAAVGVDFGTNSGIYKQALAFFGTQPNPTNAGGYLVAGYWRAVDEDTVATSAKLKGAEISEAATIPLLQQISDGTFDIDIDGATENITGLDFQSSFDLDDVIAVLNGQLSGGVASLDNIGIVITSSTTGVTSLIDFVTDPATGTYVGSLLALEDGSGAITQQGAAAGVITAESKLDAIAAVKAEVNARGYVFVDKMLTSDVTDISAFAQAEDVLVYEVFNAASNLEPTVGNPVWDVKLGGKTNFRCLYSAANNRTFAAAYMARAHTVNFRAENSALTMNLKDLPIVAEEYTEGEIVKADRVGLDIYTPFKDVGKVLSSGANDFLDNRYNIIAYIDAMQTDMFNLLAQTGTKIPQTTDGVNQLVDQAEKTTRGFRRAGVFAAGTWSSPDFFGNREAFERAILQEGFYFLAGRLSDQDQADRVARKAPVIQGAVKNAGAIHKVDIIINFNL